MKLEIKGIVICTSKRLKAFLDKKPEEGFEQDHRFLMGVYASRIAGMCFYRKHKHIGKWG